MKSEEAQVKGPLLEKPVRITEQIWPEGIIPVVSIISWVYNHEKFLRNAIEGFLMQETTFPVEIILHDDASTDLSVAIIREYEAKYPKLFRNIIRPINMWQRGINVAPEVYRYARGEFIALCEGDDYWICKAKLQSQVLFLQRNSDVSMVFHNCWVKHEESKRDYFLNYGIDKSRFTLEEIIDREWFIGTASIVFRGNSTLPSEITDYSIVGDMLIHINACRTGAAVYLDKVCSVYRRHVNGESEKLWQNGDFHYEKFRPNNIWMYWLLCERVLPGSSKDSIERRIRRIIDSILNYAVMRKKMSRNRNKLYQYLWSVILNNKPAFLSEEVILSGTPLWSIVDSQFLVFWKYHKKKQVNNVLQKIISSVFPSKLGKTPP